MNTNIDYFEAACSAIGGVFGWILGGFDPLFYALIAFVALDYITGILLAVHNKKISSKIGFKAICKKILTFLIVSMGNIADKYILGSGSALRTLLIMFYLSNEGISILENAGLMGLPIPQKLKDVIRQLNHRGDSKENQIQGPWL